MVSSLLLEAGIVFAVLAVGGTVATRANQSVIPAYIVIGMLFGPHAPEIAGVSLSFVQHREFIDLLAELGIVFLLFFLGLEFSVNQLLTRWDRIVRTGIVDFVVNFGIGLALATFLGFSVLESLFLAGIVYISSSAVITKSLIDLGWIADPESEAILGTLVFEDILIAVYLALLSAVTFGGGDIGSAGFTVAKTFVFLGVLTVISFYGTVFLDRTFSIQSDELFLLWVLGVTVLVAGIALATGVSEAVAAFFVGTAFSQTAHVERIEDIVAPTRDLFAAVFFFAIGLSTDLMVVTATAGVLLVAVVVSVFGKVASGIVGARLYGLDQRRSVRVGFGLVARGEFSLVIATLAASAGTTATMRQFIPSFTVGYVLLMSVAGTVLMRYADAVTAYVPSRTG